MNTKQKVRMLLCTMMAAVLAVTATLGLSVVVGCAGYTKEKAALNTLTTVGHSGNAAYEAYLQSVFMGETKTNGVPKVTAVYRDFISAFGVAASAARFATNTTFANPELIGMLNKLQAAIMNAKR